MERLKFLLIIGLALSLPVMAVASTIDTLSGTSITNRAIATYSNSGGTLSTNDTQGTNFRNVDTIYGTYFIATTTSTLYTSPSVATYHVGQVYNEGNSTVVVNLSSSGFLYGGSSGAAWTAQFIEDTNQDGTHQAGEVTVINSLSLSEDATNYFFFAVTPSANAADNSSGTNTFQAIVSNYSGFSTYTFYTGFNGIQYAGPTNASRLTITIVQGPYIELVKTSHVTNTATYMALGGGGNDFAPGSELTFAVNWTNSGGGSAYDFTIQDDLTSDLEYSAGTLRYVDISRQQATAGNYTAANALGDGPADDGVGSWNLEGYTNVGGRVRFNYGNAVPTGASGTVFFKAVLR
ncbi:MAG: hypothetical protein JW827_10465 [Spirochaetes bacterium]|nr:hypothetical protein [Spirochaetota bacterium]